ncbi:polysaccharide pyruvyl transferase family protein [Geobacter sulfurreducens]|uniref:polysaccharide pyruvyl transferase family protein n=1 Tax=Geobacter sulfurreducens TaxID=35554 RepID=UPI0001D8F2FC|nr:polysaccharide pyruvyl transferase family protein [Geobacter sulfurreducens]ADI84800.1 polysaccharide pyruvyl transferase-related domain [Geobacter sulfurreducens KN400]
MKIFFVNDSISNPNWGDRAAATSLKYMMKKLGAEITSVVYEEDLGQSHFKNKPVNVHSNDKSSVSLKAIAKQIVPPILLNIKQKIFQEYGRNTHIDIIPQRWEEAEDRLSYIVANRDIYSDLLDAINNADVMVIHGDGCMTGNGRIPRAELFLAFIAKRYLGKPVIIVNHTADFDHQGLLRFAQNVYPMFNDVVFRDMTSVDRCKALCTGRYAPDSAYYFKPIQKNDWLKVARRTTYFDVWPDIACFDPADSYVCLGGSSIFYYVKDQVDPIAEYIDLIGYLQTIYSGQIVLTASDIRDEAIFRKIAVDLNLPLIGLSTPVQQSVDILGNADAYIGGRWHPSIFALRGGTPVIPITSLTFKMQALIKMSGLNCEPIDALRLSQAKNYIAKQLFSYLNQGNELRSRLSAWAQGESEKAWSNLDYLKVV